MGPDFFRKYSNIITEAEAPHAFKKGDEVIFGGRDRGTVVGVGNEQSPGGTNTLYVEFPGQNGSQAISSQNLKLAPAAAPAPAAPAAPAAKAPAPRAAPGPNQVEVTFVNSGYGITGNEKPQTVERLGMDLTPGGQPILFIKSPAYGDKMQADWDAKNNRWIVDQD